MTTPTTKYTSFNTKSTVIVDYAIRLVGNYGDILSLGFSDENWARAGNVLQGLNKTLSLKHYRMLGDLMADTYVNPSLEQITSVVQAVQADLLSSRNSLY